MWAIDFGELNFVVYKMLFEDDESPSHDQIIAARHITSTAILMVTAIAWPVVQAACGGRVH